MPMNSSFVAAQADTALVPANNELSTAVQKPATPAPADTEAPVETNFVEKTEQASSQPSTSEEKKEEKAKPKKTLKTKDCRVDHKERKITITKKACSYVL